MAGGGEAGERGGEEREGRGRGKSGILTRIK